MENVGVKELCERMTDDMAELVVKAIVDLAKTGVGLNEAQRAIVSRLVCDTVTRTADVFMKVHEGGEGKGLLTCETYRR